MKHFPTENIIDRNEIIIDEYSYLGMVGRIQTWFKALEYRHADVIEEAEVSRWCLFCLDNFKDEEYFRHFETEHVNENGPVFVSNFKKLIDSQDMIDRPMKHSYYCPICFKIVSIGINHLWRHMQSFHSKPNQMIEAIKGAYKYWQLKLGKVDIG